MYVYETLLRIPLRFPFRTPLGPFNCTLAEPHVAWLRPIVLEDTALALVIHALKRRQHGRPETMKTTYVAIIVKCKNITNYFPSCLNMNEACTHANHGQHDRFTLAFTWCGNTKTSQCMETTLAPWHTSAP